jgi:hypothetical protein
MIRREEEGEKKRADERAIMSREPINQLHSLSEI